MRLLILGGTSEASALAAALAGRADIEATLSLAGRTTRPAPARLPMRIGGFGGVTGLIAYLEAQRIEAVVDATHPFAAQMSQNSVEACEAANIPRLVFTRPQWEPRSGDRWIDVATMAEAAAALGAHPRAVFLAIGRLQLAAFAQAPQHRYLVRAIERSADLDALPHHRLILSRGPFPLADEETLLRAENIEIVVSKNSGGAGAYAKIEAARKLGVPVVMVRRPAKPNVSQTTRLEEALAWLDAHRAAP
jgi:precorrin-6A/cobalt-precorrin-6A reductase